jgi:hypothetical protein
MRVLSRPRALPGCQRRRVDPLAELFMLDKLHMVTLR